MWGGCRWQVMGEVCHSLKRMIVEPATWGIVSVTSCTDVRVLRTPDARCRRQRAELTLSPGLVFERHNCDGLFRRRHSATVMTTVTKRTRCYFSRHLTNNVRLSHCKMSNNNRAGTWEEAGIRNVENMYTVTALGWRADGSRLAVGSLCGSVDIYDACVKRTRCARSETRKQTK